MFYGGKISRKKNFFLPVMTCNRSFKFSSVSEVQEGNDSCGPKGGENAFSFWTVVQREILVCYFSVDDTVELLL